MTDSPLDVALLRAVGHYRPSMDRFADALESGFATDSVASQRARARSLRPPPGRSFRSAPVARLSGYAQRWVRYPMALRKAQADVFHITDHSYAHFVSLLPAERTVVTCHDLILLRCVEDGAYRTNRLTMERMRWSVRSLPKAAVVACVSQATADDVLHYCPDIDPARVVVVPSGVDARFRPLPPGTVEARRQQLPLTNEHLLLHVSSGSFYKNAPATLRALAELRAGGLDVGLLRVGQPLTDEERSLGAQLGVLDAVAELGSRPDDDLAVLYNVADVFLFPSLYEGFGWPPLEAMAAGTPVVVSDIPALAQLVAGAAPTVPPDRPDRLAEAVAVILNDDEERQRLHKAGLARAAELSWGRALAQYADLYASVSGGRT